MGFIIFIYRFFKKVMGKMSEVSVVTWLGCSKKQLPTDFKLPKHQKGGGGFHYFLP